MKTYSQIETGGSLLKLILLAGFCGGMAEIIWVQLYASLTGHNGVEVARQVTASLLPGMADAVGAPGLGIAIHLVLALLVALVYAALVWLPFARRRGPTASVAAASAILATIWAVNFLLILPVVNPVFVTLLPYPVTLGSKLLFGMAMAGVLYTAQHADIRGIEVAH
jgi:hypothetical protein